MIINSLLAPGYLTIDNQINLFILSIEKIIVALTMTFLIINGEIDLSAPSIMGLAACVTALPLRSRASTSAIALLIALSVGLACGMFNGFWIARVGLRSLVVTLARQICYPRPGPRVCSRTDPSASSRHGSTRSASSDLVGPFPLALLLFFAHVHRGADHPAVLRLRPARST